MRGRDWRLVGRTLRLVLGIPAYAVFGAVIAVATLTLFVVSQNLALVGDAVVGGALPLENRVAILLELYPFLGTIYAPAVGTVLLVVSTLMGANLALAMYHVREHGLSVEGSGGSAVGLLFGALGAGCAACGSAVLAGLLSIVGATGVLTLLPLEGLEFSLLAVAMLCLSMFWLADGMRGGEIRGCPVDARR